jgi:predicted nucleic acid-binding protein
VLIAWLLDERRKDPTEMEGVLECVRQAMAGELTLVFAEIIKVEVLPGVKPPAARANLQKLLHRRNVQILPQDLRVLELAQEIREHYSNLPGKTPGVADSLHRVSRAVSSLPH